MTRTALVALAAAALVPSVAGAQTSAFDTGPRLMVRFADLDLKTEDGARRLARRIDDAADYVCGGQPTSAAEKGANADYRACRKAAVAASLKTVDSPMLASVVEGRRLLQLAAR